MAFTDLSPQGGTGGGGGGISIGDLISAERVEYVTLTLADIANKYVDIAVAPGSGGKVKVYTMHGCPLQFGVDYGVDVGNKRVTWTGLVLDSLVEAGDTFQIVYLTTA